MKKQLSAVLAVLVFTAGIFAAPAPTRHHPGPATAKGPVRPVFSTCNRWNLRLRLMSTDAAMGGVRGNLYRIKNVGWQTCTLEGFPRLWLYNRFWLPVFNSHVKTNEETPAEVTLAHNGYAYFDVVYNQGGAGHEGPPCPFVTRERFWAPGTAPSFRRRDHIDLCGDVTVSPVRATAEH